MLRANWEWSNGNKSKMYLTYKRDKQKENKQGFCTMVTDHVHCMLDLYKVTGVCFYYFLLSCFKIFIFYFFTFIIFNINP